MLAALSGLAGCLHDARARIVEAHVLRTVDGAQLELTQELRFSDTMRNALQNGIPLRLAYHIQGCGLDHGVVLRMRYTPLNRHYELQQEGIATVRRFTRIGGLLGALDRVRLPLQTVPAEGCSGIVGVALDLTSLPTPLRFPAFLAPDEWRMVSPHTAWPSPSPRA